jgi:hypothetical protein
LLAEFTANFEAAHTGQANIEKNGVVGDIGGEGKGLLAGFGDVHRVRIFAQGAGDEASDLPFVFD